MNSVGQKNTAILSNELSRADVLISCRKIVEKTKVSEGHFRIDMKRYVKYKDRMNGRLSFKDNVIFNSENNSRKN